MKMAAAYAEVLGAGLGMVGKKRTSSTTVEAISVVGDVSGCDILLVDDITETAGTLTAAAKLLRDNGAVSVNAMTSLEPPHRCLNIGIVDIRQAGIGRNVTGHGKTLPQLRHPRMPLAEAEPLQIRHCRPAALSDDALILADGPIGGCNRVGRKCRQRTLRHMDRARRRIEAVFEIALLLSDQSLEQRIFLRPGPRRHHRAAYPGARLCQAAQYATAIQAGPTHSTLTGHIFHDPLLAHPQRPV